MMSEPLKTTPSAIKYVFNVYEYILTLLPDIVSIVCTIYCKKLVLLVFYYMKEQSILSI